MRKILVTSLLALAMTGTANAQQGNALDLPARPAAGVASAGADNSPQCQGLATMRGRVMEFICAREIDYWAHLKVVLVHDDNKNEFVPVSCPYSGPGVKFCFILNPR